jgi:hypothetical protein
MALDAAPSNPFPLDPSISWSPLQLPSEVLLLLEVIMEEVIFLHPLFLPLVLLPSFHRPIRVVIRHFGLHGSGE